MDRLLRNLRPDMSGLGPFVRETVAEIERYHGLALKYRKEKKELIELRKVDALQIQELQAEVAQLKGNKETADMVGNDDVERKLQKLVQMYHPDGVFEDANKKLPSRRGKQVDQAVEQLGRTYRGLYEETETLVKTLYAMKKQMEHYKKRAAQWQHWSSGNNPDGVKFKTNVDSINQIPPSLLMSTTSAQPQVQACNDTSYSDIASTASNSSPPSSIPLTVIDRRPKMENDDQPPIRIKDEPVSPGSMQGQSSIPSGSQDLDEVGNTVATPRSRKFTVFEDERSRVQQDEPTPTSSRSAKRRIFQLKDINQLGPHTKLQESGSKRRRTGDRGASAISSVSEDGEHKNNGFRSKKIAQVKNETPSKSSFRDPEAHQRLDDLLAARPQKHSTPLIRTPLNPTSTPRQGHEEQMPSTRSNKSIDDCVKMPVSRSAIKRKLLHESDANDGEDWNAIMQSVPLRELPVDCLDLSCFKPNPAKNHGLDYAFKEVIRNHEQRKCIPGCMRADCCGGKFRAMVRVGDVTYDEGKHRTLLEDFLGDQKHTLDSLTADERNNLLIEAKARQLANQFGKHRHAYERPRSPPGFWRTDMPSTQELARDHIEADCMEREKVLDRVREAMRPGGLWRFADEI